MTYSIAAVDRDTGLMGIASASGAPDVSKSHYLSPGGAVVVQSLHSHEIGNLVAHKLQRGDSAQTAIGAALYPDPNHTLRQVGAIGLEGRPFTHTGANCLPWQGDVRGEDYFILGNTLAGPDVLSAMEEWFLKARGLSLAFRIKHALLGGLELGGDTRGLSSAHLSIIAPSGRVRSVSVLEHLLPTKRGSVPVGGYLAHRMHE